MRAGDSRFAVNPKMLMARMASSCVSTSPAAIVIGRIVAGEQPVQPRARWLWFRSQAAGIESNSGSLSRSRFDQRGRGIWQQTAPRRAVFQRPRRTRDDKPPAALPAP